MGLVGILGAGCWAVALGRLLCRSGHQVRLWEIDSEAAKVLSDTRQLEAKLPGVRLPEDVFIGSDLADVVRDAKFVLAAVPARFFESTLEALTASGWPQQSKGLLGIVSKGLLFPGGRRMSVEASKVLGADRIVVVSGPSHAEEVGRDMPTTLVAAGVAPEARRAVQDLLMTPRLRVYTNDDVTGVEVGGALKNVLAIASGLSDGLGFGDNSRAALITRGLREIVASGERLGGRRETLVGLAGLGDLVVTCTSRHSRNRRFGELIGQGVSVENALDQVGMVVEGYYTAQSIAILEEKHQLELPICREVYRILYERKNPSQAVDDLMLREKKAEIGYSSLSLQERRER